MSPRRIIHLLALSPEQIWVREERERIEAALGGEYGFDSLERAEIVHAIGWRALAALPDGSLDGKIVVCRPGAGPYDLMRDPDFPAARAVAGLWLARSGKARGQWDRLGFRSALLRDCAAAPISPSPVGSRSGKQMIVGTSADDDADCGLAREIARAAEETGIKVELRIPEAGLSAADRARYYAALDLCLLTERGAEGPRAIVEAATAGCRTLSLPSGIAVETLPPEWIAATPIDALGTLLEWRPDATNRPVDQALCSNLAAGNDSLAFAANLKRTYAELVPAIPASKFDPRPSRKPSPSRFGRFFPASLRASSARSSEISLWHKFYKPPWGGGNQFLLCLRKGLEARGGAVLENRLRSRTAAAIFNSIYFDIQNFARRQQKFGTPALHRIDGPFFYVRGGDRDKDELCFELNQKHADATVVQSEWSLDRIYEMGFRPVEPALIANTVDPEIFHSDGRSAFDPTRKIRLISSSWSDNPRKGGAIYKWIEEHLDWNRFDYTFVGKCSERLERIRRIDPLPSEQVAEHLRRHDIYITASQNDPCSNAVIEALACGLPVLYLNDGGHPEIVGGAGLPFIDGPDFLRQLDRLARHYSFAQRLIEVPNLDRIAELYERLLARIARRPSETPS